MKEKPRTHTQEPGIWQQGWTWASSGIPQVFPRGAGTQHTPERHLFPPEKGRSILHSHSTSLLPVLGRLPQPRHIHPGPVLQHFCALHSHKQSFVSWGRWNSWSQDCVQVCLAEQWQSNLANVCQKNDRQGTGGASCYQKDMELPGSSGFMHSTHSDRPKVWPPLPSQLAISALSFVYFSPRKSLVKPLWDATEPLGWSLVDTGSAGNRITQAVYSSISTVSLIKLSKTHR